MEHDTRNFENEKIGSLTLSDAIFGIRPRFDIMARVIHWQQSKHRAGTHHTKGMGEVSGTTKKPYKQKGTGNARQGSLRAPQFRTGGVVHGPVSRDHSYALPKKVRRFGLLSALSKKVSDGRLLLLESPEFNGSTGQVARFFDKLGTRSALFIDSVVDMKFAQAIRNIPHANVLPSVGANVLDILRHDHLIITRAGVQALTERLS